MPEISVLFGEARQHLGPGVYSVMELEYWVGRIAFGLEGVPIESVNSSFSPS